MKLKSKINNKSILIRLPNWLGDMLMAFPFLFHIKKIHQDIPIHFIVKKGLEQLLELLPFEYTYTVFDKAKNKGLSGLKNFAKQLDIHLGNDSTFLLENTSTHTSTFFKYYCMPESFSSTVMSFYINAEKKNSI